LPEPFPGPRGYAFNLFAIDLLQRTYGRKLATLLGTSTGVTERTWRNRLKTGWNPSPQDLNEHRQASENFLVKGLVREGGWSTAEARNLIIESPSTRAGQWLPVADLIYWNCGTGKARYSQSIEIGTQIDFISARLFAAKQINEINSARKEFLAASAFVRNYYTADADISEHNRIDRQIQNAMTWGELEEAATPLYASVLFIVMSCWDIEFCSTYFQGQIEAYPIFELVMPRLDPTIKFESTSGRLLRKGDRPTKRYFQKSISRLLDFVAVLVAWKRDHSPPNRIPSVKDMAVWFEETESRIVSWRDETTRFTHLHWKMIWESAIARDSGGKKPTPPWPMFVAAHLWRPLLLSKKGKLGTLIDHTAPYNFWWKVQHERLTTKGLKFGKTPWPACLVNQPGGNRFPESRRSS
jgi:hypothetical protein